MDSYKIIVKELPSPHITNLFAGLKIIPLENGKVQLIVPIVDQAALRGLLDHLWDFNATVIVMEKMDKDF